MAWRIEEHVVRGEIDNQTRDRVTGRIWFAGRAEPIELALTGNPWRDVAGRRLEFVNPAPKPGNVTLQARQVGVIGDCTASRKVKVPDVSDEELHRLLSEKKSFPWHWGNSLYLEWFSETNGRVVIESADYQLTLSPEPAWEMTAEGEVEQREANAEAMTNFMDRLGEAVAAAAVPAGDDEREDEADDFEREEEDDEGEEDDAWAPERPLTEEEAEEMQKESDRLADRIQARLDREGPNADFKKILEEELERRRRERGEEPLTPEEEAERAAWVEDMNRAAKEAMANPDPELEAEMDFEHPIAIQSFELSVRLHREVEERRWVPDNAGAEYPLIELVSSTSCAGAKLAGALNGESWPPEVEFCASKIVRLKRARSYFDDALLAMEACVEDKLAEAAWLADVKKELESLARATDELIAELRARLDRGFD